MANDPVEELHNYMQTVASVADRLQNAGDDLATEEKAFDELEDQLEQHGEGFYRDVREFNEHLGQEGEQASDEVDALAQYLAGDAANALQEGLDAVEQEEDEVQQLAQQVEERLHGAHNDLQEQGFELVRAGHEELTGSVHELESTSQQAFSMEGQPPRWRNR